MTDWTEATKPSTTWTEPDAVVPTVDGEAPITDDPWHNLWVTDVDFTPWDRASRTATETTWTENNTAE